MRQAKVAVEGVSRNGGNTNRLVTESVGTYAEKNGCFYVRYEETEASGMAGTTTVIKWSLSQVSLIRHGAYDMHQEFAEGNRYAFEYRTPYLSIPMETVTDQVRIRKLGYGWRIRLEYELVCPAAERNRMTTNILVDLR